jgi:hypothetical protein
MTIFRVPELGTYEWQQSIASVLADPPGVPSLGDRYIIAPADATGDWTGEEDMIAWCSNATGPVWTIDTPTEGFIAWNEATNSYLTYDGVSWSATLAVGDDEPFEFGADSDYWFKYNSSGTQFELWSFDVDGIETNGIVMSIQDGTDDVLFGGTVSASLLFSSGNIQIVGPRLSLGGEFMMYNAEADGFTDSLFFGGGGFSSHHDAGVEGWRNCGIGHNAMSRSTIGSANTGIGNVALWACTSGKNNSCVGRGALYALITGFDNAAFGREAGRYYGAGTGANTTGDTGTFIGGLSRASADGNTNEVVIGYNTIGNGSNTVTIGNSSATDTFLAGNVTPSVGYKSSDGTAGATSDFALTGGGTLHVKDGLVTGYTP